MILTEEIKLLSISITVLQSCIKDKLKGIKEYWVPLSDFPSSEILPKPGKAERDSIFILLCCKKGDTDRNFLQYKENIWLSMKGLINLLVTEFIFSCNLIAS